MDDFKELLCFYFSALGHVFENVAMFGDLVLRVPDITHKVSYCVLIDQKLMNKLKREAVTCVNEYIFVFAIK